MPYTSKAERERNRSMTILEALGHIQGVEGCGEIEALKQLCAALTDHPAIYSLTDEPPAPWLPSGISYAPEGPDPVWQPDKVNVAESRVWCDYGPHPTTKKRGRNRPVLILRVGVQSTWPKANDSKQQSRNRLSGRPLELRLKVIKAIQELYPQGGAELEKRAVLRSEVIERIKQSVSPRTIKRALNDIHNGQKQELVEQTSK